MHDKAGNLKWEAEADNVVTDVGANQLLDSAFGSAPVPGPCRTYRFIGYTGIPMTGDTIASNPSGGDAWVEAGNGSNYPDWSTPASNARATMSFSAASGRAKALSSAASFCNCNKWWNCQKDVSLYSDLVLPLQIIVLLVFFTQQEYLQVVIK